MDDLEAFKNSLNISRHSTPISCKPRSTWIEASENTPNTTKSTVKLSARINGISEAQLNKIYKGKCADLGIPVLKDQLRRFLQSCQYYFKNRRFSLKDMNLGKSSALAIANFLAISSDFYHVDLSKNVFGDVGVNTLCSKLLKNISVVHLDISSNDLTPEGAKQALEKLGGQQSIISLDLSAHEGLHRNRLGKIGSIALQDYMKTNRIIMHLNIGGTSIGNEGADILAKGLGSAKSLLSLDLSNNNISNIESLCKGFAQSSIKILNFSGNKIGNEGSGYLSMLIAGVYNGPCMFASLDLSKNSISTKGLGRLLGSIRQNIYLVSLNLDKNDFSGGLSNDFVPFMQGNSVLRSLSLNHCALNDMKHVQEGLSINKGLASLSLIKNSISDEEATDIAYGLSKNSTLRTLNLSGNKIRNEGGVALANALRINCVLESIVLKENALTNVVGQAFNEVSRLNSTLLKINLEGNIVDVKYTEEIQGNLMKNLKHHKKTIVPQLKEKLEVLAVGTSKAKLLQCHIGKMEKEKREVRARIPKHCTRLETAKIEEEAKTQALKNQYKSLRKEYQDISSKLYDQLEIYRNQSLVFEKELKHLADKITNVEYDVHRTEVIKAQKENMYNNERFKLNQEVERLKTELRNSECAYRIAQNSLQALIAKKIKKPRKKSCKAKRNI